MAEAVDVSVAEDDFVSSSDADDHDDLENRGDVRGLRILQRERIFVDVRSIRELGDPSFQEHFRMKRTVFEKLIVVIGNHLLDNNQIKRLRTALDLALLMSLWILANMDAFRTVALIFNVARSTLHKQYRVIIKALSELAPKYVKWPTWLERERMKREVEAHTGMPGVIGYIDGTQINITAPAIQPQRFVNRHHSYSVNVQAVCDSNLLFRDLFIGQPGSVHDARMYKRSPLAQNILRPDYLDPDEHIFGDGAYQLTEKLVTPYRDNGNLDARQKHFNYVHSKCRSTIERSFGQCKGKWRRLKKFYSKNFDYTLNHIVACFVLHNFIILEGDESEGLLVDVQVIDVLDEINNDGEGEILEALRQGGIQKRDQMARLLHP